MGGFLFFQNLYADTAKVPKKPFYADVFLFRIVDTVYSLNESKAIYQDLKILKCIYPESLLKDVFKGVISSGADKKLFKVKDYTKKRYSRDQIFFFKRLIRFAKLKSYIQSHKVNLNSNLDNLFYQSALKNKCSLSVFGPKKKFESKFLQLVRMEIFLRSRYVLDEKKLAKDQTAAQGVKSLIKSIENQI